MKAWIADRRSPFPRTDLLLSTCAPEFRQNAMEVEITETLYNEARLDNPLPLFYRDPAGKLMDVAETYGMLSSAGNREVKRLKEIALAVLG